MTGTMRGVAADAPGGPDRLRLRTDLPVPEPAPGEVRIRVAWCGLVPLDAVARAGRLDFMPVRFPFVPGLEHTGVVDAVGDPADAEWLGRRVLSRRGFGGCAECSVAKIPALVPLDPRIDLRTGAVYRGCATTAWHLVHVAARVANGQTVLVHSAAGPVGAMLTQIARDAGARVVGLAGGPAKIEYARAFGADVLIDYLRDDWPEQVLQATSRRGVDVIFDGNGGAAGALNYGLAAPLGQIFWIGANAGSFPPYPSGAELIARNLRIGGFTLGAIEHLHRERADREIVEAVVSGRWRVPMGRQARLEDVPRLHADLDARRIMGRAVIEVGGEL
jgi:NADPH2:quinone reductase